MQAKVPRLGERSICASQRVIWRVLGTSWQERREQWKRYARLLTRNSSDADDVVQEALTRTLRAGPDLTVERVVNTYVRAAIRTSALDFIHHKKRLVQLDDQTAAERQSAASTALELMIDTEHAAERRQLDKHVKATLRQLSPTRRQVVELIVLRDPPLKLREVAELQGVSTSAVHYRLQAAIDELREAVLTWRPKT